MFACSETISLYGYNFHSSYIYRLLTLKDNYVTNIAQMEGQKLFYVTYIVQMGGVKNILCDKYCTNGKGKNILF